MSEEKTNVNGNDSAEETQKTDQTTGNAPENSEQHMVPKARLDQATAKRRDAEKALADIADELTQDVPEDMRELIPDLAPVDKVKWIRAAKAKGLFAKPAPSGPDSKRPGGKPPTDLDSLSPYDMRAAGYKT